MAYLIQQFNDEEIARWELGKTAQTIGRGDTADIVLKDASISREHCLLKRRKGAYYLTDLNSSNGTRMRGRRVLQARLLDGDEVTIGKYVLVFVDKEQSIELSSSLPDAERLLLAYEGGHRKAGKGREWSIHVTGKDMDRRIAMTRPDYLVGSGYNCDIILEDKRVAPIHALITMTEGLIAVLRIAEKEEVYVNNSPVPEEIAVSTAAVVAVGPYALSLEPSD